jgi:hypothetical protein
MPNYFIFIFIFGFGFERIGDKDNNGTVSNEAG